ncbi:MAG: putative metal-binding motif-containing protein [Myxococcota bacterium]
MLSVLLVSSAWANVFPDTDNDGFVASMDCDDTRSDVYPGAPEVCDFADNNCDGQVDEGFDTRWYPDNDGDGFGDSRQLPVLSCDPIAYYVTDAQDCDDTTPFVSPIQPEICNGLDDDCDRRFDNGPTVVALYPDLDGDGFGDDNVDALLGCKPYGVPGYFVDAGALAVPPTLRTDVVEDDEDCDDTASEVSPLATELCDGFDNNCNEAIDEGCPVSDTGMTGDTAGLADTGAPQKPSPTPSSEPDEGRRSGCWATGGRLGALVLFPGWLLRRRRISSPTSPAKTSPSEGPRPLAQ